MKRLVIAVVSAGLLASLPGSALAATKDGCKAQSSAFAPARIALDWEPGDPIPAPGDEWWAITNAGLAAEGLTPEDAVELFGLDSVADLYALATLGIREPDHNGNGIICWKPFPDTSNGKPAYIFNVVDDHP